MGDGIARFRDFTDDAGPIQFQVGAQTFTAVPEIPLARVTELASLSKGAGDEGMVEGIKRVFVHLLEPDSYTRFVEGMEGTANPIGIGTVTKILPWLMEQYGLRPTEASSGSVSTLTEDGASSTDGPTAEAVTSA